MTTTTTARSGNFYGRLWARTPRELGFLLLTLPIAVAGFTATISLVSASAGTLVTFFLGVFVLIAALYVSRGFGTVELVRLRWAGFSPIERPEWQDARARQGFWGWLRSVVGNGHYWLALLHTLIVNFVVSLFTWIVTVVWVSVGVGGATNWLWQLLFPTSFNVGSDGTYVTWPFDSRTIPHETARVLDAILWTIIGLGMIALLPFVTRGLTAIHYYIARGLLGAWKSDALQRQVIDLNESRGAAAAAEGHSLRRLERDIHDGPQQRLVRLQMDLAAADRQLDVDPDAARALISEAMQQSKDALEELRALSRGFAPPMLLDRGLVAALESAAGRSPIATRVVNDLPEATILPQETERNAYFVASELLTNAIKHSGASEIGIRVATHQLPDSTETWLDVVVTDNGSGGATFTPGHGLAGLDERLRGLGGVLTLSSPVSGPTIASAQLPLPASTPPTA